MSTVRSSRIAGVIVLAGVSPFEAQSLNSRLSRQEFAAVYGSAEATSAASEASTWGDLDLSDSRLMTFAGSREGFVRQELRRPLFGSVSLWHSDDHAITGPLSQFTRIEASGFTESMAEVSTASSGSRCSTRATCPASRAPSTSISS